MKIQPTGDVALHDCHPVGRQSASLVRADRCRVAHCLARVQMSHQIVIVHHFLQLQQPAI